MRRWNLFYFQWTVTAILMLFPLVFLAIPRGESANLYVLVLCGFIALGFRLKPMGKSLSQLIREYWPISVAMAGLVFAIFINHLMNGSFSSRAYEMPFQLACFSLLFWLLLLMPNDNLKNMQWSLAAGAFFCLVILYIDTKGGAIRAFHSVKVPLIPFGNIAILMGVLALLSIGWNNRSEKMAIVLKTVAGLGAIFGSYLSQSRGGWVALPLFLLIGFVVFRNIQRRFKVGLLLLAITVMYGSYMFSDTVQQRIGQAESDIQQYFAGNDKNTSVGIRLQLWEGSWVLFKENPVFGVGLDRYPEAANQLQMRHVITPQAASQPHPHNDLLFYMATLGIFGLLAMLSLYFVPAAYFFGALRSSDRETRTIAGMGLALCLGYFVFGLTDVMFYWRVSYSFYVILLAVLFACLVKRRAFLVSQRLPQ